MKKAAPGVSRGASGIGDVQVNWQLNDWIQQVKAGKILDFGANLVY